MKALPLLVLPCLIWLGSCASTSIDFTPYSVTTQGLYRMVDSCQLGYVGDTSYLLDAEAAEIGTVHVSGNRFADQIDIRERAQKMCAENGGTHVILLKKGESISSQQVTPDTTTFSASGGSVVAKTMAGISVPVSSPNGEFRIFRVEAKRIATLPPALQPAVPAQHAQFSLPAKPAAPDIETGEPGFLTDKNLTIGMIVEPRDLADSKKICCRVYKLETSPTETAGCLVPQSKESLFRTCIRGQLKSRSTIQP